MRRPGQSICAAALALALGGCVTSPPGTVPPTPEQIVAMSRQGAPSADIIARIRASNAVYPLTVTELVQLHDQGVANEVLDYLQAAYLGAVRSDERNRVYWEQGAWHPYPWYGYPHWHRWP